MIGAGILAVSLTLGNCANSYSRIHSSAASFGHYFQGLERTEVALNPIERLVFSLILANTRTHQMEKTAQPARG